MVKERGGPRKPILLLLAVIGALVVVSVLLLLTRGAPKALDAASPAGVVQGYATAYVQGDDAAAARFLAPGGQGECNGFESFPVERNLRIALVSTTQHDATADVVVSISRGTVNGPFGSPEYTSEESFGLALEGGRWLITRVPWPLQSCQGKEVAP